MTDHAKWLLNVGGVVIMVLSSACADLDTSGSRLIRRPEGDILTVRGEYSIVILRPDFMVRLFGPDWKKQELFYGFNRAIDAEGNRGNVTVNMLPLAKGRPELTLSGVDWSDLICPIYSLDTRQQAILAIDLRSGTITVSRTVQSRPGKPRITQDGRLVFGVEE